VNLEIVGYDHADVGEFVGVKLDVRNSSSRVRKERSQQEPPPPQQRNQRIVRVRKSIKKENMDFRMIHEKIVVLHEETEEVDTSGDKIQITKLGCVPVECIKGDDIGRVVSVDGVNGSGDGVEITIESINETSTQFGQRSHGEIARRLEHVFL